MSQVAPQVAGSITIDGVEYELVRRISAEPAVSIFVSPNGQSAADLANQMREHIDTSYDYLTKTRRYHP